MIPRIDRNRVFPGVIAVKNSNDTWIFNGLYNTITICRDGKILNQKIYEDFTV